MTAANPAAALAAAYGTLKREVALVVADVLGAEMGLDQEHCLLGDQKWNIPKDKKLFLVVYDDGGPVVGAANFLDTDPASDTVGKEVQQSSVLHALRVEQMSFDDEARIRKEEPGLALAGFAAQNAMSEFGICIYRPQPPVNASETEVTARLLKYVVRVNVSALHQKIKPPPGAGFYDKFNGASTPGTAKPPEVSTQ